MNNEQIYWIVSGILVISLAIWMISYLTGCPHQWNVVDRYERRRASDNKLIGYTLIKECQACHKLKKEEITL